MTGARRSQSIPGMAKDWAAEARISSLLHTVRCGSETHLMAIDSSFPTGKAADV
jgi:hypothetical protein